MLLTKYFFFLIHKHRLVDYDYNSQSAASEQVFPIKGVVEAARTVGGGLEVLP